MHCGCSAPAHPTPAHSDLLRTACAPTSTHSNGFWVKWVYITFLAFEFEQMHLAGSKLESRLKHRPTRTLEYKPQNTHVICNRPPDVFLAPYRTRFGV